MKRRICLALHIGCLVTVCASFEHPKGYSSGVWIPETEHYAQKNDGSIDWTFRIRHRAFSERKILQQRHRKLSSVPVPHARPGKRKSTGFVVLGCSLTLLALCGMGFLSWFRSSSKLQSEQLQSETLRTSTGSFNSGHLLNGIPDSVAKSKKKKSRSRFNPRRLLCCLDINAKPSQPPLHNLGLQASNESHFTGPSRVQETAVPRAEHVVTLEPQPRLENSLTFDHKQAFDHKQEAALEISPENSEPDTSRDPDPLIPFPLGLGRRMPYLRAGHQLPFSADDEEHMAARLDHAIIEWCKKKQMPPRLPRHLNRVKLGQIKLQCQNGRPIVLGSGGLGKVYLGSIHDEDCAVKVCLEGTVKEQARFLAEVEQLETLRTNTVMRYLAWSVCPEGLVVLAEYLPGGSLMQALEEGSYTEPSQYQYYGRGKRVMMRVAIALFHLHERNVAHLAVSSSNILLDESGDGKLADFGLQMLDKFERTCTMSAPMSMRYSSPEQLLGRSGCASDVWAFGTILWEVCTCEKTPGNRILRPIRIGEEAPQEIVDLLSRCHERDWERRISAKELCAQLNACPWPGDNPY